MKVVVDTNNLLESINRKRPAYNLYLVFQELKFDWVISNEIYLEYREVLTKFYSEDTAEYVLCRPLNSTNVVFQEPYFKWDLIQIDSSDNKFVDLAISSNDDYLVTNDKHFHILK
ncbi:MAG: putative toxin-antitoxin system toxin component, PIN family [Chitinophagales bacterium]